VGPPRLNLLAELIGDHLADVAAGELPTAYHTLTNFRTVTLTDLRLIGLLLDIGELNRLYIAPGVEDVSGGASGFVGAVVQDHAPIAHLPQRASHPCAGRANTYHHISPNPRLRGPLP
jgi:hypothetical protein